MRTKFTFFLVIILISGLVPFNFTKAENLSFRLKGKILLQVESNGEAWYVNPENEKRYYLSRPADAFSVMRRLGLGAKHDFFTENTIFPNQVLGKILLDVEQNGEAYYN